MTQFDAGTTALADITGDYTIDPAHTRLGFVARHAMVTKVRGQFNGVHRHRPRRHGEPGGVLGLPQHQRDHRRHRQRRPRRPPPLRRLLRHRREPRDHLHLHRRRPRRQHLERHRRPDHQGHQQVGHASSSTRSARPRTRSATSGSASRARPRSTARTGTSPGTPRSRPAACSSPTRSPSSSTSRRSRTPELHRSRARVRPATTESRPGPAFAWMPRMTDELPAGLSTRPLTMDDAQAVVDVMSADQRDVLGRVDIELADIVGDWQRPSYDLATCTIGVFDDDRMVGYAEVGVTGRGDAAVQPDHRGRGIGTWLAQLDAGDRGRASARRWPRCRCRRARPATGCSMPLGYRVRWESWVLDLPSGAHRRRPRPARRLRRARGRPGRVPRRCHDVLEDAFLEWSERERETYEEFEATSLRRPGFEPWHLRVVVDEAGAVVAAAQLSVFRGDDEARSTWRGWRPGATSAAAAWPSACSPTPSPPAASAASRGAGLDTDSRTGALGPLREGRHGRHLDLGEPRDRRALTTLLTWERSSPGATSCSTPSPPAAWARCGACTTGRTAG